MIPGPAQSHRWPVQKFFWAVIDAPGLTRSGPLPPGLRAEFEEQVPVNIDELHIVCTPMEGGRLLACGAPFDAVAALGDSALTLTPQSAPPFVPDGADMSNLNLLTGPLEPRPLRRARARRSALSIATVALCATLACVGLNRRTRAWEHEAGDAADAARLMARSVDPEMTELSLDVALESARRGAQVVARPPADAALALASLLTSWPTTVASRPLTLAVGADTASISVAVDGDPAPFLKAISPPPGWSLDEPRLMTAEKVSRLNLTLRHQSEATP